MQELVYVYLELLLSLQLGIKTYPPVWLGYIGAEATGIRGYGTRFGEFEPLSSEFYGFHFLVGHSSPSSNLTGHHKLLASAYRATCAYGDRSQIAWRRRATAGAAPDQVSVYNSLEVVRL